MSTQLRTDLRAWTAETCDPPELWRCSLSPAFLAALDDAVRGFDIEARPLTDARFPPPLLTDCRGELAAVFNELESGRGFVILGALRADQLAAREQALRYWLIGQALGVPFEQNVQGTLLYDVRDTGQGVAYGARFSVTNAESTFHTDNSFGETVLDYVGLLCVRGARSGGLSQIVSGLTVYRELLATRPGVIEELSRPFHVDRRGGVRPGEPPTIRFPIVERRGDELLFRYLRYWIEAGHQKVGQPLKAERVAALDALDEVLNRRDLRVEFSLKPGEMLFVNNRWILHNRTTFEDHPEPEKKRHYVRLWLRAC
jgi:alpha-ketoglutarate-dependent taurine dioxygenase